MDNADSLERWLRVLVSRGAADLFLVAGFAPAIRLNGLVTPIPEAPLEGETIEAAVLPTASPAGTRSVPQ